MEKAEGVMSMLDQDLYKFCMQLAIREHYPNVQVKYDFINRNQNMMHSYKAYKWLADQILELENLVMQKEEIEYLEKTCKYMTSEYLDFLRGFKFNPRSQISIAFVPCTGSRPKPVQELIKSTSESNHNDYAVDDEQLGSISLSVTGIWSDVILYEVPVLALVSESYYKFVDLDWDSGEETQREQIREKVVMLLCNGCSFSEFGTRRRRSFKVHDLIVQELAILAQSDYKAVKNLLVSKSRPESKTASTPVSEHELESEAGSKGQHRSENGVETRLELGKIAGTSNVFLAKRYGLMPSGTVGHEWTMGTAAIERTFTSGNKLALYKWTATFKQNLSIALTDTFGINSFFNNFDYYLSNTLAGIRHDSGDPVKLVDMAIAHYRKMGIDPKTKFVVFSDGLDVERAINLQSVCDRKGIRCVFGIGTNFTNDFAKASNSIDVENKNIKNKSKPMNIVVKLMECNGFGCVKLSDDPGKHSGYKSDIDRALAELKLN